jgi:hypothetical protein
LFSFDIENQRVYYFILNEKMASEYEAPNLPQVLDDGTTTFTYGDDFISQSSIVNPQSFPSSVRQLAEAGEAVSLDRNNDSFGNGEANARGGSMFG